MGGGEGAHQQAEADGSKSRSQSGKDEREMVAAQFEGRHAIDEGQEIHAGEYHEHQLEQTDGGIDHDFAPQDGEIGDGQGADAVVGAFVALGEHAARERNDDEKHGEEGKGRHVVLHEGGFDDGVFALGVALGDEDEVVVFEIVVEFDAFAQVFGEVEFHFAGLGINFEVGGQVVAHAFLEFVGEDLLHHFELPKEIVFDGGLQLGVELGGESLEEGVEDDFDFYGLHQSLEGACDGVFVGVAGGWVEIDAHIVGFCGFEGGGAWGGVVGEALLDAANGFGFGALGGVFLNDDAHLIVACHDFALGSGGVEGCGAYLFDDMKIARFVQTVFNGFAEIFVVVVHKKDVGFVVVEFLEGVVLSACHGKDKDEGHQKKDNQPGYVADDLNEFFANDGSELFHGLVSKFASG